MEQAGGRPRTDGRDRADMPIEKTARQFAEQPSPPRTPRGDSKLDMIEFHANGFTCLAGEFVFTEQILGFIKGKLVFNYCTLNTH